MSRRTTSPTRSGRFRDAFPAADIIVHQEAAGLEDERLDHKIAAVEP